MPTSSEFSRVIAGTDARPQLYSNAEAWDNWADEEEGKSIEVPGLGVVTLVSNDRSDWEGDQARMVFSVRLGDNIWYFQKTGWYSSYGDTEWDGSCVEVVPKPIQKTEWVKL